MDCNICLRPVGADGANGVCGPCRRLETPESNPDLLEEE